MIVGGGGRHLDPSAFASASRAGYRVLQAGCDARHWVVGVPSHGGIGGAALSAKDREYLKMVQTRVGELKAQGKSADETVQAVTTEVQAKFPDWAQPPRIGAAARAAYAEAR